MAFLDLLPEALRLGSRAMPSSTVPAISALAFFAYATLDRLILVHPYGGGSASAASTRGWVGAGSLSVHSLMDGLALGIGFQASVAIGVVVAVAILAHDFSDGMNTVSIVFKHGGSRRAAFGWLLADATAPVIGAGGSFLVAPKPDDLASILAAFAGFFLYIGASDLLPDSFAENRRATTTLATLAGAATLFAAVRLAS